MTQSLAPPAWWHAPLAGPNLAAQPWPTPWEAPQAYADLVAAFADPVLHHLACGLAEAPNAVDLRTAMSDPPDVHLWRLQPAAAGRGPGPLLVHSIYTTQHRLGVWSGGGAALPEPLWAAAVDAAAEAVFRHEPEASHVFIHLGLPTQVWQEAFLLRAGFDPFEVDEGYSPIARELYGLSREVHAQLRAGG